MLMTSLARDADALGSIKVEVDNGDMIIYSSKYASFKSTATIEPRQRISNIYIYLYVSDQSVFIGSELLIKF